MMVTVGGCLKPEFIEAIVDEDGEKTNITVQCICDEKITIHMDSYKEKQFFSGDCTCGLHYIGEVKT